MTVNLQIYSNFANSYQFFKYAFIFIMSEKSALMNCYNDAKSILSLKQEIGKYFPA